MKAPRERQNSSASWLLPTALAGEAIKRNADESIERCLEKLTTKIQELVN
jgi:hypothetical protein